MAKNDIQVIKNPGLIDEYVVVAAASTAISLGEPCLRCGHLAVLAGDGTPVVGGAVNCGNLIGIANEESDETSSADGSVSITTVNADTVLRGLATTSTNVDTASEIVALRNNSVAFDYDGTTYTIDENDSDDPNVNGLIIIGGDPNRSSLDVMVHLNATTKASLEGQTMD